LSPPTDDRENETASPATGVMSTVKVATDATQNLQDIEGSYAFIQDGQV
jgi:hypothetical protein